MPAQNLEEIQKNVQVALKEWHGPGNRTSPLAAMVMFRDVQQNGLVSEGHATNLLLAQTLDVLEEQYAVDVAFLKKRYIDEMSIRQLAHYFHVAESTVYSMQRQAIGRLADCLWKLERAKAQKQQAILNSRLEPSSYVRLCGVQEHLATLQQLLAKNEPPWLMAVEGIGGIGKTSLADALVRQIIESGEFSQIGWVSARQAHLNLGGMLSEDNEPALSADEMVEKLALQLLDSDLATSELNASQRKMHLRTRLKETPHLIVVDNLETIRDVEGLLPTLHDLANPTKFVLTTREQLWAAPNIYHFGLPELSDKYALALLRQEAEIGNVSSIVACGDDGLQPILDVVGGNPLALRLVIGHAHVHPLASILDDLQAAKGASAQNLYTFIYRQAWENLDFLTQRAFLTMPIARPAGDDVAYLAAVGDLAEDELREALNQLVRLNLVNAHGSAEEKRYSIHSLTRTFLQEQVAKWV